VSLANVLGLHSGAARAAIQAAPMAAIKHGQLRQQRHLPMLLLSKAEFDKRSVLQKRDQCSSRAGADADSGCGSAKRRRTDAAGHCNDDNKDSDSSGDSDCSSASTQGSAAGMATQHKGDEDYLDFR